MDLLDLFFPRICLECGRRGKYICEECLEKVGYADSPAIFAYRGIIRKAIVALKYKFAFSLADELAQACVTELGKRNYQTRTMLVPIPLHSKRKSWRGFNQTGIVGRLIAQALNWGFADDLLVRTEAGQPQVGLSKRQRLRNMRGKFAVKSNVRISKNHNLLVFDDVVTSGATLQEARKALKAKGFTKISFLTIAG